MEKILNSQTFPKPDNYLERGNRALLDNASLIDNEVVVIKKFLPYGIWCKHLNHWDWWVHHSSKNPGWDRFMISMKRVNEVFNRTIINGT